MEDKDTENEVYNKGKIDGMREVVKWIKNYEHNTYYIFVNYEQWQAKKKEWGIR